MSGWYIYIIATGIGFMTVAGLVLQIKANRQFGLLKSWLIPFEEVLYCFRNWSSASLVAKFFYSASS